MKAIAARWKSETSDKAFIISAIVGFLLLMGAFVFNYFAGLYATEKASNPVTDIILSNIPAFNVDGIFLFGPIIFWIIMIIACLKEPHRIPFFLKIIALFVVVRSIFISLTHLGPFPSQIEIDVWKGIETFNILFFNAGADLFFSGHTGMPFLMALIFWKNINLRIFCLTSAVFFGIVVLLGHLHYSIDVLAAFFITYSIYHLGVLLFRKDLQRFNETSSPTPL